MKRMYLYIMDSIQNLNGFLFHNGSVPWPRWWDRRAYYSTRYSERLELQAPGRGSMFFGPCKKAMRREIREEMNRSPSDSFYIMGLSNAKFKPREIVYFMGINRKMTFEEAYNDYPIFRGTGIHIKPIKNKREYIIHHYGKKCVELNYEHLGVFLKCKSAPHSKIKEWVKDIAGDQLQYNTLGPDCCFIGTKDSVFLGKKNIEIDDEFCELLKDGILFKGHLNKAIDVDNPIPNPRGNHLVLSGKNASIMVRKLKQLGDKT